jgi:hypothetical protein
MKPTMVPRNAHRDDYYPPDSDYEKVTVSANEFVNYIRSTIPTGHRSSRTKYVFDNIQKESQGERIVSRSNLATRSNSIIGSPWKIGDTFNPSLPGPVVMYATGLQPPPLSQPTVFNNSQYYQQSHFPKPGMSITNAHQHHDDNSMVRHEVSHTNEQHTKVLGNEIESTCSFTRKRKGIEKPVSKG